MQRVFVPGAIRELAAAEEARDADAKPPKAEDVKLWMPSELLPEMRLAGCASGVVEMEVSLREAQCNDSLHKLRSHLHSQHHLINERNRDVRGQYESTRSQTLISEVGHRTRAAGNKYRHARLRLFALKDAANYKHTFKPLKDTDMHVDRTIQSDAHAMAKLSRAGGNGGARAKKNTVGKDSTGKKTKGKEKKDICWLWTTGGAPGEKVDGKLHCCKYPSVHSVVALLTGLCTLAVRVQWVKARARKQRWYEEVALLREEMRRVRAFLEWDSQRWEGRAKGWDGLMPDIKAGLVAYAHRQASIRNQIHATFTARWSLSTAEAAKEAALDNILI